MKKTKIIINSFLLLQLFFLTINCYGQRVYYAEGENAAVSCAHPLAAKVAIDTLKKGGNAIDAAVSASFVLGVVEFSNSGLGGEGFALICNKNGKSIAIDGSTRRPDNNKKFDYDCPISLPAIPEMLIKMNRFYGKLPLADLLKPAINLCERGFKVSPYLASIIAKNKNLLNDDASKNLLFPEGKPLQINHVLKQPALAKTLKQLSVDNGLSFYYGDDASRMIEDMNSKGSSYTKFDLMSYKSRLCKPVIQRYKNFNLIGNPLPSSSAITIKLAKELLQKNINLNPDNSLELEKLTKSYKRYLSIKHFYSSEFYNNSQSLFATEFNLNNENAIETNDGNTTHLCVWDKNNTVVSMTLTIGNHFGAGKLAPGGFFYANNLRTFSPIIVKYPDKYPSKAGSVTSKSPVIVTQNGMPWLAIGGAGADRIITNTATILAKILKGQNSYKAVQEPRYFEDHTDCLIIENDSENHSKFNKTSKSLKRKPYLDDYFGLISVIQKENNKLKAVGDKRRDGSCLAY